MTHIPPTTTYEIDKPDASPCCGAPLELVSPPLGYECRECMGEYTLNVTEETAVCDEVITSGEREGERCGRELPCPYHSED